MMMMMMKKKKETKKKKKKEEEEKWISQSHWTLHRVDWKITNGNSEGFAASSFFIA